MEIRTAMKPATLARSRKKKGTRWIHHEGILSKRAFGFFRGIAETDDHDLVATHDCRYLRCITERNDPSFRITLIHSGSFVTLHVG